MGEWKSCAGRVYRGAWVTPFPCKKNATIEEGGKWWCKQHAPSLAAERIEKRNAEWRRKREAERAAASRKDAIASAERAVIEAVVRARRKWGRIPVEDLRHVGVDEDDLEIYAAVDALIAAREGR